MVDFENFKFCWDEGLDEVSYTPFQVACRDRGAPFGEERWVLTFLTKEEVREIYEYIRRYFEQEYGA